MDCYLRVDVYVVYGIPAQRSVLCTALLTPPHPTIRRGCPNSPGGHKAVARQSKLQRDENSKNHSHGSDVRCLIDIAAGNRYLLRLRLRP